MSKLEPNRSEKPRPGARLGEHFPGPARFPEASRKGLATGSRGGRSLHAQHRASSALTYTTAWR